jgi:hypothetical protein
LSSTLLPLAGRARRNCLTDRILFGENAIRHKAHCTAGIAVATSCGGRRPAAELEIMLVERIDNVAPEMPPFIRHWFLEQDYAMPSVQYQDWDLVLADWNYLPLLIEYAEESANPLEKRFEAFMAIMILQESCSGEVEAERKRIVNQEIERIVLGNHNFARKLCDGWLGLIETLIVQKILGEEIPSDIPEWMREEIRNRLFLHAKADW